MSKSLDQLAETHSCIVALLESRIISPATRHDLELFRDKLEVEIKQLAHLNPSEDIAAD